MYLPFDTEIPTLEIYPEDTLPKVTKYIYVELPTASLFVTVKYWKQSKLPDRGQQLNKVQQSRTVEYYAGVKKNDKDFCAMTCSDFQDAKF